MTARLLSCLCAVLLLAMALVASDAWAQSSKRFALVIGNSKYEHTQSLPNAAGDADEIAAKLKQLGFDVDLGIDLTRQDFKNLVSDFRAKIKAAAAEDVVFFYGGHGFSLDGFNHLVPVDAGLKDKDLLAYETLTLDEVIESIRVTKKQNTVVFIDACRNNPLPKNLRGDGVGEGLSELKMSLRGTLVSFATEHGQLTGDGLGKDSPYARALLKYIDTPNQSVSDLLVNVRNSVSSETNEKQFPVEQGALFGQVIFNRGGDADGDVIAAVEKQPELELPKTVPPEAAPAEDEGMFSDPIPETPAEAPAVEAPPVTPEIIPQDAQPDQKPANAAPVPEMGTAGSSGELPSGSATVDEVAPNSGKGDSLSVEKSIEEEYQPTAPETNFNTDTLASDEAVQPSVGGSEGSVSYEVASRTIDPIVEAGKTTAESGATAPELPSAGSGAVIEGVEVLSGAEQPADDGGMTFEAPVPEQSAASVAPVAPLPPAAGTPAKTEEKEIVIALNTPPEKNVEEAEVVKGIQEELRRVGCFDGSPDGKWGDKSAVALGDYFKQKGKSEAGLEPSDQVLGELKSDSSDEVCVAMAEPSDSGSQPAKASTGTGQKSKKTETRKSEPKKPERKKPEQKKPERKKPDQKKPEQKKPAEKKPAAPAKKKPVLIIGM